MKIAVDLDDTLSVLDRVKAGTAYLVRKNLPVKIHNADSHALQEVFGWTEEEAIRFVREGGITLFTDAPARNGVREVLQGWRNDGHQVVVLTARKKTWFSNAEKISRDWLEKRRIPYDELVSDEEEKGKYCREHGVGILIDDNLQTCLDAQENGVNAVLFVDKHNLPRAREVKFGGANWKQINEAVRYIISRTQ